MDFTNDYLSDKVKRLSPYVAGLQPRDAGWVKLNTNENPYPPSPKVCEAIKNADIARLRLYPDGDSAALCEAIAADLGVNAENIFCGNSSDEVLALAFQAFYSGKDNILAPDISYGFYPVWGKMYDVEFRRIPLRGDFSINIDEYKDANGVVIANPNAPTSLALGLSDIDRLLCQNPKGVVLVDEAYVDFADVESAVELLAQSGEAAGQAESCSARVENRFYQKYLNLLVVRTFSKSHALAGLRVGYAVGHPKLIEALKRVKDAFNSYPLDMLAQAAATAAIQDRPYLEKTIKEVVATRSRTTARLQAMGYHVLHSQTNFILFKAPDAEGLYNHLLSHKILARYWNTPRLKDYLRVSIGTNTDMEAFIQCVQEYTSARPMRPI